MAKSPKALDVWMNGEFVGEWHVTRSGTQTFQYTEAWAHSPHGRALSLSLPIVPGNRTHQGPVVTNWFDNLLPDSKNIRERLSRKFHAGTTNSFDLLSALGRDCVGAVQIVPTGLNPGNVRSIEAQAISDAQVAQKLRGVTTSKLFGIGDDSDDFRISIAGAQEKTALLRLGDKWHIPLGATPTTHILKLPLGLIANLQANMHDSVENEWLCMHFLQALGLPSANTDIATFQDELGEKKALIVQRFDREFSPRTETSAEWITRLPQEDLCQAKGISAERKYESDGGPGVRTALELCTGSETAAQDTLNFAKAQLAFWLLAATDGHAKNFSIFLRRDGYRFTPLYDVISAWPIIGNGPGLLPYQKAKLAMALRGSKPYYLISRIPMRQWRALAAQTGVEGAFDEMRGLVESSETALRRLEPTLPRHFPEHVWRTISDGVARHRRDFLDMSRKIPSC